MAQIFISYARQDGETVAAHLQTILEETGHIVWRDRSAMRGGEHWRDQIHQAIIDSHALVLVITPQAMQSENTEFEWRTALNLSKRVIGVMIEPTDVPADLGDLHYHTATTPDLYENMTLRLLRDLRELDLSLVARQDSRPDLLSDALMSTIEDAVREQFRRITRRRESGAHRRLVDPYKALFAYDLIDERIFFGRDTASQTLERTVLRDRMAVLHARSGAGKSSIINAGLMPRLLHNGYVPVYARVAKADPIEAIQRALLSASPRPAPPEVRDLSLHQFLRIAEGALEAQQPALVIILDQFEEFFVFYPRMEQRQPFIDAIADCYDDPNLRVHFLLSLRIDYLGYLAEFKPRLPRILHNEFNLPAMTMDQAKAAITGPVREVDERITYEPALIDEMLADLDARNMELPHLQIICSQLYASRVPEATSITREDYAAQGQARGILGGYLDKTLTALPDEERRIADDLLFELISSQGTKSILDRERLVEAADQPEERVDVVLAKLVDARLLRRDTETQAGRVLYEMAHEYLIDEIRRRADANPEKVALKLSRELLRGAVYSFNQGILMSQALLDRLDEQREQLGRLDDDELTCILVSSIDSFHRVDDWMTYDAESTLRLLARYVEQGRDHNPRVRRKVVGNLPRLGRAAVPLLVRLHNSPDGTLRSRANAALRQIDAELAYGLSFFSTSDLDVTTLREELLRALRGRDWIATMDRLAELLQPEDAPAINHLLTTATTQRRAYVYAVKEILEAADLEQGKARYRARRETARKEAEKAAQLNNVKSKVQKPAAKKSEPRPRKPPSRDSRSERIRAFRMLQVSTTEIDWSKLSEDALRALNNTAIEEHLDIALKQLDTRRWDWRVSIAEQLQDYLAVDAIIAMLTKIRQSNNYIWHEKRNWLQQIMRARFRDVYDDYFSANPEKKAEQDAWETTHLNQLNLNPKLLDGFIDHREQAVRSYAGRSDEEAIAHLIYALRDSSWHVVRRAADALGSTGSLRAIPALIEACFDYNGDQFAALRALIRLHTPGGGPDISMKSP